MSSPRTSLLEQVWPGLSVEDGNIHVHISALRKALDEGAGGKSYVVTVPGRGYRLIGLQAVSGGNGREPDNSDADAAANEPGDQILPHA